MRKGRIAGTFLALVCAPALGVAAFEPQISSGFELADPIEINSSILGRDRQALSSQELLSAGTESARAGRLEEAIALFRELLGREPENVAAHNNLACCLKRQGDSASALSEFEKAVANNPGKAALHINLARALIDLGQYDRAIETLYTAIRLEQNSQAQLLLGRSLSLKGDWGAAVTAYQEALKADPSLIEAHLELGDALRAVQHFDQALIEYKAVEASSSAQVSKRDLSLRQAKCYEGLGQFEQARLLLVALLEKTPEDSDSLNCMGVVLWKLGHAPEAAFVLEQALKRDPGFLQARNNLGIVLYDLKRYQDAVDVWRQALGLKPDYPQAHYNLGVALYQTGLTEQAAEAFRECLKFAPDDAKAHNNLGLALLKLGNRDAAVLEWKRALEYNANLSEAQANLAHKNE